MPIAGLVTMLFPSLRMHVGHLLHERLKLAIVLRPDHKMPMLCEAPNYVKLNVGHRGFRLFCCIRAVIDCT
jgi:hypothetical protein